MITSSYCWRSQKVWKQVPPLSSSPLSLPPSFYSFCLFTHGGMLLSVCCYKWCCVAGGMAAGSPWVGLLPLPSLLSLLFSPFPPPPASLCPPFSPFSSPFFPIHLPWPYDLNLYYIAGTYVTVYVKTSPHAHTHAHAHAHTHAHTRTHTHTHTHTHTFKYKFGLSIFQCRYITKTNHPCAYTQSVCGHVYIHWLKTYAYNASVGIYVLMTSSVVGIFP